MTSLAKQAVYVARLARARPSTSYTTTALIRRHQSNLPQSPHKSQPDFPDLMTPDPLMDLYDSQTFQPTPKYPYRSRIISRNDPSMFKVHNDIAREKHGVQDQDKISLEDEAIASGDTLTAALSVLPMTPNERAKLHRYALVSGSVVQQTSKGRIRRIGYLVVMGNGNGLVGYGEGKDLDSAKALSKACLEAQRNLDHVERFEDRTIWSDMEGKFGSTRILLRPRPVGFGLHCNPYIHQVLKAAGIKDISAKVWGSRNPTMVIKLLLRMLQAGNAPLGMGNGFGGAGKRLDKGSGMRGKEDCERERGRKLVALWH